MECGSKARKNTASFEGGTSPSTPTLFATFKVAMAELASASTSRPIGYQLSSPSNLIPSRNIVQFFVKTFVDS